MKTGDELLAVIKAYNGAKPAEVIRAAGYVTTTPSGQERLQRMAFYRAAAIAKGVFAGPTDRPAQRKLSFQGTVITTGAVQIGQRYADQIGLKPGDPFKIEIKRGTIAVSAMHFATKS